MALKSKSIFKSKTFWFNLVSGIIAGATLVDPELLDAIGSTHQQQKAVMAIIGLINGIGNIILRGGSSQPVYVSQKKIQNNENEN